MTLPVVVGAPLAVLAFVLPGLALVRRDEWERGEPFEIGAVAGAGSIAWWAIGIWVVGLTGIPLSVFAVISLVAASAVVWRWHRAGAAAAWRLWRSERWAAAMVLLLAVVIISRLAFGWTRLGFSVGDMTAHAYMAELMVMRDGLPGTYEPFLPIGDFGSFPPGFHSLAAVETLLAGVPTYRSTIHVLAFALIVLTLSVAALLRAVGVGRVAAPVSAIIAVSMARNPQFFAQWGGGPTLLAAGVVMLVLRDTLALGERRDPHFLGRLALLSAATVLVHQLPVASFAYVALIAVVALAWRDRPRWTTFATQGAIVVLVSAVLVIPFALRAPLAIPPSVEGWAREWFQGELGSALSLQSRLMPGEAGVVTWPFFLVVYIGILPVLLLLGGIAMRLRWNRDRATVLALALLAAHFVMFAGAIGEWALLWPSLYPTRIGIWLAPALAIAIAGLPGFVANRLPRSAMVVATTVWALAVCMEGMRLSKTRFGTAFYDAAKHGMNPVAVVGNEAVLGAYWITTFARDNAVLTRDDIEAMSWIRANVDTTAVFETNFGDAGPLLPAVAHRRVLAPHFNLDFFYADTLAAWRRTQPTHLYVGAIESPAHPQRFRADSLDGDPGVERVYASGRARVYRILAP